MRSFWASLCLCGYCLLVFSQNTAPPKRNVIIFVADGLRAGSVNATDTPALWSIRQQGVHFANSHSLFPTFTMANASAIATGHAIGDTGVFSNVIWTGYPTYSGTPVPFLETDQMLADLTSHFDKQFPTEISLLSAAAQQGYNAASVGKVGPAGLVNLGTTPPFIVDDSTGNLDVFPLPASIIDAMKKIGLSIDSPTRSNGYGPTSAWNNGYAGTVKQPGTRQANIVQQQWFADVTTRAILPSFKRELPKPFLLLYWSRDPDGTQHNQGDSLGSLSPGINGPTARLALQNADRNLKQILNWLDSNPPIKANTDIFVTSDHGFATISKREIAPGIVTKSESAKQSYVDTEPGFLPYGFLAIDLALALNTNLFDPDQRAPAGSGRTFQQVRLGPNVFEHPTLGNGLLGSDVKKEDGSDAIAIVAANGGSDLIYVPNQNAATVQQIVKLLTTRDYASGIFVDDMYGPLPGTLPMSAVGLVGSTSVPRPAIVVGFKEFYLAPDDLQTAIQVSDASQRQGQGMHGGLGRDNTFINMAAIGPDFKARYIDPAPVSNADIAPTIARILGIQLPSKGTLRGRVITEALRGGMNPMASTARSLASDPIDDRRTIIHFQEFGGVRYLNRGCFIEKLMSCP
jgi:arylsulfatase A-like enzyme